MLDCCQLYDRVVVNWGGLVSNSLAVRLQGVGSRVVYAVVPHSHLQLALYCVLWIGLVKVFLKTNKSHQCLFLPVQKSIRCSVNRNGIKWHPTEWLRAWLSYGKFMAEVLFHPKMPEFLPVAFNLVFFFFAIQNTCCSAYYFFLHLFHWLNILV